MLDLSHHDAQIRQLYTTGTPSLEIARLLDIDLIDVVGRVRAMELQPPGMGVRRNRDAMGAMAMMAPRPAPCSADPDPLPAAALTAAPMAAAPAMAAPQPRRLASPARPNGAPATQARPVPPPVAQSRPAAAPARAAAVPVMVADDDDEDEGVRTLPGRPRGWLMAEAEVEELFSRAGQRFQDVILRKRP